jgi:hypothetical protein
MAVSNDLAATSPAFEGKKRPVVGSLDAPVAPDLLAADRDAMWQAAFEGNGTLHRMLGWQCGVHGLHTD